MNSEKMAYVLKYFARSVVKASDQPVYWYLCEGKLRSKT